MRIGNDVIPAAGAHGGDGAAVAAALGLDPAAMLDLSASMNPAAPDPFPVLRRHLRAGLTHYPDPRPARDALAAAIGVDADHLLVTNGGAEAISLLAGYLGGQVREPDFALYPRGGGPWWRSNPHSPSGRLATTAEHADVWDEAFYPLATGSWTRGDAGVPVVGSLTKLLATPGLRAGYVLADPAVVDACQAAQPQWSVNGLVASALPDLLEQLDVPASARRITQLRRELITLLTGYGLTCHDTDANWVLVDEPGLREQLAPHGVLVRDCTSFGMPGIARVAVPDADGLARLDQALARVCGTERTS